MAIPWSVDLLDLDTLKLRRQLAGLPSKIFHLDYEGLRMDSISEVVPVQEVCKKALAPHSTTTALNKTNLSLAPRAERFGPLDAPPAERGHSHARTAASASEPTEQSFSSGLAGPRYGQPFENIFTWLDAGGLLDDFDPPSAAASTSGQRLRPSASTALEVAPTLPSASARASPAHTPPVSFAPSQPRAAVPESENSACAFFAAPRSVDEILDLSMDS